MSSKSRLQYLDWMRGLAVVLMIETHVFDAFLKTQLRTSEWYWLSQFLGGMPAPLFLFLAGISFALVLDRLREKGAVTSASIEKVLRRGAWILFLAYAFRIEQLVVWYPYTDWSQIHKVDILNCIALSSLAVGLCSAPIRNRRRNAWTMGAIVAAIVVVTPWVFQMHDGLPALMLEYINGFNGIAHPNYFMFFSWAAFTFAGSALGYLLIDARARGTEEQFILRSAACGIVLFWMGYYLNYLPWFKYGFFDYSLTSPQYFLVRLGYMFIFLYAAYRLCGNVDENRWSPLLVFGQTSLLVYWVHIEFVYGRLRMFRNTLGIGATAAQLLWLVPLMMALSAARLRWSAKKRAEVH